MKIKFYLNGVADKEFGDSVFGDIPDLKYEINPYDVKTNAGNIELKFLLADADENGDDRAQLRYLFEHHYDEITRVYVRKDNGIDLFMGVLDKAEELHYNYEDGIYSMKMLGLLSEKFDEEVWIGIDDTWGSLFYDGAFNPSIITNLYDNYLTDYVLIVEEIDWKLNRPIEVGLATSYPDTMYDYKYALPWEYYIYSSPLPESPNMTLKEVLNIISILGNCDIIISGSSIIIHQRKQYSSGTVGGGWDGKLAIVESKSYRIDKIEYNLPDESNLNLRNKGGGTSDSKDADQMRDLIDVFLDATVYSKKFRDYFIEGYNRNIQISHTIEIDGHILNLRLLERDLSFIEETFQPVKIEGIEIIN